MKYVYVVHTDKNWDRTFNGPVLDDLHIGVADILSRYFKCKVSVVRNYVPVPASLSFTISQYHLDISPEQETEIELSDKLKIGMHGLGDMVLAKTVAIGSVYTPDVSARVRIIEFKDSISQWRRNEDPIVYSVHKSFGSGPASKIIMRSSEEIEVAKICGKDNDLHNKWYIIRIQMIADL